MGATLSKKAGKAEAVGRADGQPAGSSNGWLVAAGEPEAVHAPLPHNEYERLAALRNLDIKQASERRFDDITKLCCMIFKVPVSLVALVDERDVVWFKSLQGYPGHPLQRKLAFCAWTIFTEAPTLHVVEDTLADGRFVRNPYVIGPPNIRFYAGCPLVSSNGYHLGTLCVIDQKPRAFSAEEYNVLANMTELAMRELERDALLTGNEQRTEDLSKENTQLLRAIDCFTEGIMLCNLSDPKWPILFLNEAWEKLTGMSRDDGYSRDFWDMFKVTGGPGTEARQYVSLIARGATFDMRAATLAGKAGKELHLQFRSASTATVDSFMPLIGIPASVASAKDVPQYYFVLVGDKPRSSPVLSGQTRAATATGAPAGEACYQSQSSSSGSSRSSLDAPEDIQLGPLLGKGSYGRVYRGHWNGAQVAVKILDHCGADSASRGELERLLNQKVNFPNVMSTYKSFTRPVGATSENGAPLLETWLVLEFCNKGPLGDAIERGWFRRKDSLFDSALAPILATAKEVASAMSYLHDCGILHGDLTSSNVLLTGSEKDARRFTAKVADFGLSRVLGAGGAAIKTRTIGTITHMPPELLRDGVLSTATDVYSFGVILWELYCGRRPYAGMSPADIIHQVTGGKQLDMPVTAPAGLCALIAQCTALKPEARPTFQQIVKQLAALEKELVLD